MAGAAAREPSIAALDRGVGTVSLVQNHYLQLMKTSSSRRYWSICRSFSASSLALVTRDRRSRDFVGLPGSLELWDQTLEKRRVSSRGCPELEPVAEKLFPGRASQPSTGVAGG